MLWITICCHFHFDAYSLTNQRRANPKVIYLGSLMLMPLQQQTHFALVPTFPRTRTEMLATQARLRVPLNLTETPKNGHS